MGATIDVMDKVPRSFEFDDFKDLSNSIKVLMDQVGKISTKCIDSDQLIKNFIKWVSIDERSNRVVLFLAFQSITTMVDEINKNANLKNINKNAIKALLEDDNIPSAFKEKAQEFLSKLEN